MTAHAARVTAAILKEHLVYLDAEAQRGGPVPVIPAVKATCLAQALMDELPKHGLAIVEIQQRGRADDGCT